MKVAQLLSIFPQLRWGQAALLEVGAITLDSRQVKKGSVFVALRGHTSDGHQYVEKAIEHGAVALVVEDDQMIPASYGGAIVKVPSTQVALNQLARKYYDDPAALLFCVGVTGTNGKTTVTYMIEKIFSHFGWVTGVMGTIDHHLLHHRWSTALTTPDVLTLQRRLKEFVVLEARAVACEVSSHALAQGRVDSLPLNVGVFTNLSRDHLDYHKTMDDYFFTKEKLFINILGEQNRLAVAVLNGDDPWVRKVRVHEGVTTWWFGQKDCDFLFRVLRADLNGTLFHLSTPRGVAEIHLHSPGIHNVYNAVAAIAATSVAGVSLETAGKALAEFHGAPGRMEKIPNSRGLYLFVDYAHTDDALRTVLRALKELFSAQRSAHQIITVFGCGGDRDRGKRPLMGKAAAEFSDQIILTSDNPRFEDPLQIIVDVQAGIPTDWSGCLQLESDRRQALALALQTAREGDVILVAGKGHEDYQIIGGERLNFSDTQVLSELLKE